MRENPYLQFFLGYSSYRSEVLFDLECMQKINETIIAAQKKAKQKTCDKDSDENGGGSDKANSGKLIIDATCAPADITHPTDLKLVNQARQKSEAIIDRLHACAPAIIISIIGRVP